MDKPIYLHTDDYYHMIDKLEAAHLVGNPAELRNRLIMILGEIGNVWPVSCFTGDEYQLGEI